MDPDDLTSFQTGVDTIVSGCTTYGSTPTASTPSAIVESIKTIYTNRYNAGVTATKKGNATAAQVLSGKTFTNSSTVGATGTMTNRGAWTSTPTAKGKVTIPAGYHSGSGYVDTNSVYTAGYNAGKAAAGGDKTHTVAVKVVEYVWDNDTARIGIYVDGVLKSSGSHGSFALDNVYDRMPAAITV